jgi:large subunit ribosomal protein L34e
MPRPGLRARSLRKVKIKLPGGASIIHYFRRRPSGAVCANCKKPLHGVPRERDASLKGIPKSRRRPERPYGGNLCPSCAREKVKSRLR